MTWYYNWKYAWLQNGSCFFVVDIHWRTKNKKKQQNHARDHYYHSIITFKTNMANSKWIIKYNYLIKLWCTFMGQLYKPCNSKMDVYVSVSASLLGIFSLINGQKFKYVWQIKYKQYNDLTQYLHFEKPGFHSKCIKIFTESLMIYLYTILHIFVKCLLC